MVPHEKWIIPCPSGFGETENLKTPGVEVAVAVAVGVKVKVFVGVKVTVKVGVKVTVGLWVPVVVFVGEAVIVGVEVRVGETVIVNVGVGVKTGVRVPVEVKVAVGIRERLLGKADTDVGVKVAVVPKVGLGQIPWDWPAAKIRPANSIKTIKKIQMVFLMKSSLRFISIPGRPPLPFPGKRRPFHPSSPSRRCATRR